MISLHTTNIYRLTPYTTEIPAHCRPGVPKYCRLIPEVGSCCLAPYLPAAFFSMRCDIRAIFWEDPVKEEHLYIPRAWKNQHSTYLRCLFSSHRRHCRMYEGFSFKEHMIESYYSLVSQEERVIKECTSMLCISPNQRQQPSRCDRVRLFVHTY